MESNKLDYCLLAKEDLRFAPLRKTLDSVSVSLRKAGIGMKCKHADVLSLEEEQVIWDSGFINTDSPWNLTRAVLLTVGLHFSLKGGQEHRDLKAEQLTRFPSDGVYTEKSYYEYIEHG